MVRTAQQWAGAGFNVAIFGRPSDSGELGYEDRISNSHLQDIRAVLNWVESKSSLPIWVVGTSRGTISSTFTLNHAQDPQIAGGVLSASVVAYEKPGAISRQDLKAIKVPVLLYHHEKDACEICQPYELPSVLAGLKNTPIKKLIMAKDGSNPTGSPCEANHWHGFIGMERQAVSEISGWIRHPVN